MNRRLSTEHYKRKIIADLQSKYGFADPVMVSGMAQRYAEARRSARGEKDFNPFTDDPNCKTCRKKKQLRSDSNDSRKKSTKEKSG